MARSVPWRNRCPVEVAQRISAALSSGLLVVQQPGPMSFVLKCSGTQRKFKVRIGDPHHCNCKEQNGELLCVHILFVLLKVFRLPQDNPLVWQHALLEAEVDQLLRGHFAAQRKATRVEGADGKTIVHRRDVGPDDECPICCDAITDERPLVFCRFGCGNNIHAACFKQYASHNSTNPSPLLCPLCREQWGQLDSGVSHGVICSECHGPINGERYKCAFCRTFDLCSTCFHCPLVHPQHPFNVAIAPGQAFRPAERPVRRTVTTAPGGMPAPVNLGSLSAEQQALLMRGTDFGPEDYEALLRLDDGVEPRAVLTDDQVRSLPTLRYDAAAMLDTCAICLEQFRATEVLVCLPVCSHNFHPACAMRWFTECKAVCPIDNIPVAVRPPQQPPPPQRSAPSTSTRGGRGAASRPQHPRTQQSQRLETGGPRGGNLPPHQTRMPNMSLTGYCPTNSDLSMLFVGNINAAAAAAPVPSVAVVRAPMRGRPMAPRPL